MKIVVIFEKMYTRKLEVLIFKNWIFKIYSFDADAKKIFLTEYLIFASSFSASRIERTRVFSSCKLIFLRRRSKCKSRLCNCSRSVLTRFWSWYTTADCQQTKLICHKRKFKNFLFLVMTNIVDFILRKSFHVAVLVPKL